VAQVDERVAPAGHPDRNLTHLRESLSSTLRSLPSRSTRCRWKRSTWKPRRRDTPRLSE
jgi:hypothetical protein